MGGKTLEDSSQFHFDPEITNFLRYASSESKGTAPLSSGQSEKISTEVKDVAHKVLKADEKKEPVNDQAQSKIDNPKP